MRRVVAVVFAFVTGVATACSGSDDGDREGTTPRPDDTPVTSVIDYSGVALDGVAGATTTTVREQGAASVVGAVAGPSGPVPGATVRVERLLDGQEVRTDLQAGPDGRFELRNVPGGRYRVRAFLAPTLAMVEPDVRFLRDGEEHVFDLTLTDQRGVIARASVAPDPPILGEAVNLVAVVASRSVDTDGVVRSTPISGIRVELSGLGAWRLRADDPVPSRPLLPRQLTTTTTSFGPRSGAAITNGLGQVRFELRCSLPGAAGLSLLVPVTVQAAPPTPDLPPPPPTTRIDSLSLTVPDCVDPAASPPTSADGEVDPEDAQARVP